MTGLTIRAMAFTPISHACPGQRMRAGWGRLGQAVAALVLLLFAATLAAQSGLQPVPALTDRVIDQTGTLSPAETAVIRQKLAALEERFGTQVVVLMVATTAPEDIAPYAHRVADTWKIGRADVGDGLLLVIAKNDRTLRFEVARALEGTIPDLRAARIIDEQITPAFRQGNFAAGILAGLDGVEAALAGDPPPAPAASTGVRTSTHPAADMPTVIVLAYFLMSLGAPLMRWLLGRKLGALASGAAAGALVYLLSGALLAAVIAGIAGMLIAFSMGSQLGVGAGPRGGRGGGFGGGGFGGGGFGGGGFSSGGGGSFGGGGASGRW